MKKINKNKNYKDKGKNNNYKNNWKSIINKENKWHKN